MVPFDDDAPPAERHAAEQERSSRRSRKTRTGRRIDQDICARTVTVTHHVWHPGRWGIVAPDAAPGKQRNQALAEVSGGLATRRLSVEFVARRSNGRPVR